MIELEDLTKRFGPHLAVDHLTFEVPQGQVLGFLGPNGAGKSTTMKMITGYLTPSEGTARVCGFDVRRDPVAVKARVGYLPEGAPAWPDMTPIGFLQFTAAVRGYSGAERNRRIAEAAEKVNLKGVMEQPIGTLSKGYKRRVGLAQALLHDPQVMILDEPTDGLDPNQKHEVRQLIRDMAGEKAIVISTHILEEVEAVCDRAIVISRGRIVADATPAELEARSSRHNGVLIRLAGDADKAAAILRALPAVASVERLPDGRLICSPADGAHIAGSVADALRNAGVAFDEMQVERGRLDEVFRSITVGETADA